MLPLPGGEGRGEGERSTKFCSVLFLVFGLLLAAPLANADEGLSLVAAEYFWDVDPGVSNGVPVAVSANGSFTVGYPGSSPLNVDIASLNAGLHQLGFRVFDATGRASDVTWLPVQVEDATTLPVSGVTGPISDAGKLLVAAEYFWDADPGTSNGVPVSMAAAQSLGRGFPTTNGLNVDLSALNTGLHQLGVRTVDASGRWSEINWLPVQVEDATTLPVSGVTGPISDAGKLLVAAEYFWDADPGTNNGVPVSVAAAQSFGRGFPTTNGLNVNLSALNTGLHQFGFRTADASGRWSAINWLPVQVEDATTLPVSGVTGPISDAGKLLVAAEYFWDADPGTSNGVPVSVAAAESFGRGFPTTNGLNVDLTALNTGLHQLGVRTVDASGRWSEINWLPVQVEDAATLPVSGVTGPISDAGKLLVAAEYFWDADPGTSNGVAVNFPARQTFVPGSGGLTPLIVPVPQLYLGLHRLGLRVRAASGDWSAVEWTPIQLDRKTEFALNNVITVTTNTVTTNVVVPTITCSDGGQLCSQLFALPVTTHSLLTVRFTNSPAACSDLRIHFRVDAVEKAVTARLAPGGGSAWFELGPVAAGAHLLELQAEGFLGGCNVGNIPPWSGTLQVVTSTLSTNIGGGDFAHAGGLGTGVAATDFNGDTYPDVFEGYADQPGKLFRNNLVGGLNQTNSLPTTNLLSAQTAAWADYDNDGLVDLFVTTKDRALSPHNLLYRNLGTNGFALVNVTNLPSLESNSVGCAWADVDLDGFVDLAVASFSRGEIGLYRNNGDGTFTDVSSAAALTTGSATAVAFGDFNNDHLPDLVAVGAGGVFLFENRGTNGWMVVTNSGVANDTTARSAAWGDFDNDGWPDLFVASGSVLGALYHNNQNGTFTQVQVPTFNQPGYEAVACAWEDIDQDGRLDLFVTSGTTNNPNRMFRNDVGSVFTVFNGGPAASPPGRYAGAAWADLDANGTPDLLVANSAGTNLLYNNLGSGANWLQFKLSGRPSNRSGIGTKIRVLANIDGQPLWQMREISGGNGYGSQNDLLVTFGMGDATAINLIQVDWPSGLTNEYINVTPNQLLRLSELPEGVPVVKVNDTFSADYRFEFINPDPVTVTIESPFLDGWIFYTSDGTEPDFTANWYLGPFQVSAPTIIRAVAYDFDLTTQALGTPVELILVPTYQLTDATPGGGGIAFEPPGPNYLDGTTVTAIATNAPGWTWLNWAGGFSGTNRTNTFVMNSSKEIIAQFGTPLTAAPLGGPSYGTVSVAPSVPLYAHSSRPRLTTFPQPDKYFVRWGLGGSPDTTLTNNPMDWPVTVANASFLALLANLPTNNFSLTVPIVGEGHVSRNPYAPFYTNGTQVTLTANATNGQIFLGWSGDLTNAQNPIVVTMNSSKVITATFGAVPPLFAFSAAAYAVDEAAGSVNLSVVNNGIPGMVDFATVAGTAVGGNGSTGDYVSTNGTLSFAYGETNKTFAIGIRDNFLLGADRILQVQLSNPTGGSGSLTNPSTATVVIHYNDIVTTNGSQLVQAAPGPVPDRSGSLRVTLVPPVPAVDGGFWRFPWELAWRPAGLVTNMVQETYPVEFRQIPGYQVATVDPQLVFSNAPPTEITNQYIAVGPTGAGQLTVQIGPNNPIVTTNAGWRLLGESVWRSPGTSATNLATGNEVVEFKSVIGLAAPPAREVAVYANQESVITAYYQLPSTLPPGAALPTPLASLNFINESFTNSPRLPFTFNGQLQTDLGVGSGVAALSNVVLSAAHVVFNDAALAYVGSVNWFFQQQTRELDPKPLSARGWYVLSGYAAARTNDLPPVGGLSPGVSSAQSRNFDVAAIYFLSPAARGGFGGYLSSDLPVNEWLTSTNSKMLVGYPLDGTPFGYTNVVKGKMHSVVASNYSFTLQTNRVYSTAGFLNFPGNSGGPVCVLGTNNVFYPAAVYLGTVANASAVRAIDSDVVSLLNLAQASATYGDEGTNFTGGGVIRIVSSGGGGSRGYLTVNIGPPAALQAGGGWRLTGETNGFSSVTGAQRNFDRQVTNTIEFANPTGWDSPPSRTVIVPVGQVTVIDASYLALPPTMTLNPLGLGITGTTNTSYRIEYRTNLTAGMWLPLRTNTLGAGLNLILPWPPTNGPAAFYRAVWLP